MHIKAPGVDIDGVSNGTVTMNSGDHLTVGYTDPHGHFHSFVVAAQHLMFMAIHEQSEATVLIRPGGVTAMPPNKTGPIYPL